VWVWGLRCASGGTCKTDRLSRPLSRPHVFLRTDGNESALKVLVYTTMAMFGVPAIVMLVSYTLVLDQLFTFRSAGDKMMYAGIAGICSVQLVIFGFVFYAFSETDAQSKKRS
jgi:hypothetical protein